MNPCITGFNGERSDPVSGVTHLGNGYRAYSPELMRFTCPDSMSPFGAGGINPYAYCDGDPVNHADLTGHLSWQAWLGIGMGIVGLGLAIFTAGASIAAAGGVIAAIESASAVSLVIGTAGVVSDVTAIASGAAEESNPQASAILGWVSLGTGVVGLAHGIYGAGRAGARGLKKLGNFVGDWQYRLQHAGPCLSTARRASASEAIAMDQVGDGGSAFVRADSEDPGFIVKKLKPHRLNSASRAADIRNLNKESGMYRCVYGEDAVRLPSDYYSNPDVHIGSIRVRRFSGQTLDKFSASDFTSGDRETLVRAYQDLHDKGVLHIDVKRENILFSPRSGQFHIIDFGESLYLDDIISERERTQRMEGELSSVRFMTEGWPE